MKLIKEDETFQDAYNDEIHHQHIHFLRRIMDNKSCGIKIATNMGEEVKFKNIRKRLKVQVTNVSRTLLQSLRMFKFITN